VELNDICHFRVELDTESDIVNQDFFLEIELMFSDLLNQGGPDKFQLQQSLKELDLEVEFKCMSI